PGPAASPARPRGPLPAAAPRAGRRTPRLAAPRSAPPRSAPPAPARGLGRASLRDAAVPAFRPPPHSRSDWIGPPDRRSNLRPIVFHVPPDESRRERRLRELRQDTQAWNQRFWAQQNVAFQQVSAPRGPGSPRARGQRTTLNAEEMADFYKDFLSKNFRKHMRYNRDWYKRNFAITFLMGQVALERALRWLRWKKKNLGN
uniref:Cytochrome c oxidase assembly factor 8 n=1 Tax=Nothoprocta perdicaria TaxID=30464 RepID=A0A8C6YY15_NOTPE